MSVAVRVGVAAATLLVLSSCGGDSNFDTPSEPAVITETSQTRATAARTETTAAPSAEPVGEEETEQTDFIITAPRAGFETLSPPDALSVTANGFDGGVPEISALLADFDGVLSRYGENAGFLYYAIDGGSSVEYNADKKFSAASIIKAPYARAVLSVRTDLTEAFEMTEETLNSPSELLGGKPVGSYFTVEELIEAALKRSDNTAFKMLYHYVGYDCFNDYSQSIGVPCRMTDENYWFRLTARQTAVYFKDICYFAKERQNGELLLECLKDSQTDLFARELKEYAVAGKYGFLPEEDSYTLGCASIVCAKEPFLLVGYVTGGSGDDLDYGFFRDTARLAAQLHEASFKSASESPSMKAKRP